jgi:hypothetical protein
VDVIDERLASSPIKHPGFTCGASFSRQEYAVIAFDESRVENLLEPGIKPPRRQRLRRAALHRPVHAFENGH